MTLLDEIEDLKKYIQTDKPLTLKDAIPITPDTYQRIFTNGYVDIVPINDLYKPVFVKLNQDIAIDELMNHEISPISKMGMNLKLNSINTHRKKVSLPTETLFFS